MINCPACQTPNLAGTFFCIECGASFLPSRARDTTASLGGLASSIASDVTPQPMTAAPPELAPPVLRVVILNSGRKVGFNTEQPIVIGRQDSTRSFYPDIDLSSDGGLDAGVSRRHATITIRNGACYIEDLGSSNGTFLNKDRVVQGTVKPLHHGDEIRLGNILMRVELTS